MYLGRILGILLVIINAGIWFLYLHFYQLDNYSLLLNIGFPLLCLPTFWWLGKLYDLSKIQAKELKTNRDKFETIYQKARIGIALIDERGRIVQCNPMLQEFLGYSENELKKMTFNDFSDPDDAKTNMKLLSQLVNKEIDSYQLEKRYVRKDGKVVWGQVTSSLFPNKEGNLSYVIGMVIDITGRKLAEKERLDVHLKLAALSNSDGLTGIANRRFFDEQYMFAWANAKKQSHCLSLIILDIDFFKLYNDTYGHLAGDTCLKQVAAVIRATSEKQNCVAARIGGEEFAVILPNVNSEQAFEIGEKIRIAVEELHQPHKKSLISDYVTISVGVATMVPGENDIPEDLFDYADKALYESKMAGRNKTSCYTSLLPMEKKECILCRYSCNHFLG